MNAFNTFSLPPSLDLDPDKLREIYQKLAAKHHPDNGGCKTRFENVNQAYLILQSPAKRLTAYMDAENIEHDPRGTVSNDLMDLFMQVGSLVQEADSFIRKKSAASSILAKALLEGESMELQDHISALIAKLEHHQEHLQSRFSDKIDTLELSPIARNLAFLEKWQAQLQQRYGALF